MQRDQSRPIPEQMILMKLFKNILYSATSEVQLTLMSWFFLVNQKRIAVWFLIKLMSLMSQFFLVIKKEIAETV